VVIESGAARRALADQEAALRAQLRENAYPADAAGNLGMIRAMLRPGAGAIRHRDAGSDRACATMSTAPARKAMTKAVASGLTAIRSFLAGGMPGTRAAGC